MLHFRLQQLTLPQLAAHDVTWAQRTPASAPAVARELAAGLDDRVRALGERMAASPQPWLARQLGVIAPDGSPALREEYTRRAGLAAAYREAAGITDPDQAVSLEPHRGNPELENMRNAVFAALEIRDEAEILRGLHRGELEAQVLAGERAQASAPLDVSGTLRVTAQAEADARRQSADAEVQHDETGAASAKTLARQLAAERQRLEAGSIRYETWAVGTRDIRAAADKARAELRRRDTPSQRKNGRPGPTSLGRRPDGGASSNRISKLPNAPSPGSARPPSTPGNPGRHSAHPSRTRHLHPSRMPGRPRRPARQLSLRLRSLSRTTGRRGWTNCSHGPARPPDASRHSKPDGRQAANTPRGSNEKPRPSPKPGAKPRPGIRPRSRCKGRSASATPDQLVDPAIYPARADPAPACSAGQNWDAARRPAAPPGSGSSFSARQPKACTAQCRPSTGPKTLNCAPRRRMRQPMAASPHTSGGSFTRGHLPASP